VSTVRRNEGHEEKYRAVIEGRLAVRLQGRIDEWESRPPVWVAHGPESSVRTGIALARAFHTCLRCTPNFRATARIVPAPCLYSRRICSYSSTLALLFCKTMSPEHKANFTAENNEPIHRACAVMHPPSKREPYRPPRMSTPK
jgi:hypothetical protein